MIIFISSGIWWKPLCFHKYFSLQRHRSRHLLLFILNDIFVEHLPQDGNQVLSHPILLFKTTMVLNGENQRKIRSFKSIFLASLDNILEEYLRCECVAMVDYWFSMEKIRGKSDLSKAYFLQAWTTSLKSILDVSVWPW